MSEDQSQSADSSALGLPKSIRSTAAWSWRILAIGLALAAILWVIVQLRIIVIPLLIAVLLTALLAPLVSKIRSWGAPKWVGVVSALLLLFAAVAALTLLIVTQLRTLSGSFGQRSRKSYMDVLEWLSDGPLHLSRQQIDAYVDTLLQSLEQNSSTIWSGALSVGTTVGHILAGLLLTLFSLIFLLIDGPRIWRWVVSLVPRAARAALDGAGRAGWVSVGHYVRIQIFVAFVDAVGIGIGAAVLGVPMVFPIAVMVFLGSFVPFLGTIVAGTIATFIALVYNGPVNALILLGVVILVNQIEGHILQPLVMGNAVRVHPLAVVLAVSAGTLVAGVPGALFAVPIVASLNSMAKYLNSGVWRGRPDPLSLPPEKWMAEAAAEAKAELGVNELMQAEARAKAKAQKRKGE
jgi:predicted PurR-regulated permease PerM